jgi:flagellar biogenesis protein FliO
MHLVRKEDLPVEVAPEGLVRRTLVGLRRFRVGRAQVGRKQMRVVETLKIGRNRRLILVSCSGERFLVATGGGGVETMMRVRPEKAEVCESANPASWGDGIGRAFMHDR